jgi:nucleoside-diphosphate-sugar epimerase
MTPRLDTIATEDDLELELSRPYAEDVDFARRLDGDVLVLGAGGKMGPTLVRRILLALREAGSRLRVIAVSRFSAPAERQKLESWGAATLAGDLLDARFLASLPDCPHVISMVARKFGSTGAEGLTWAMNAYLPGRVAERFASSRLAVFSTGNVYPLATVASGGSRESDALAPVGEYGQSCLGRERLLDHFSRANGTRVVILRLNYAVEARYGVLADIAGRVWRGEPVPLGTSHVNVIWQGDANSAAFRALALAASPPRVLNLAGAELLAVRWLATELGRRLDRAPRFEGEETGTGLLSNASECHRLLGPPRVPVADLLDLTARWIRAGGRMLGKPTRFEVRDGKF